MHQVVPDDLSVRDTEPQRRRLSRRQAAADLLGRQPEAGSIVFPGGARRLGGLAPGLELGRRAEAWVGPPLVAQAEGEPAMGLDMTGLKVRPLVPGDPQPLQSLQDGPDALLGGALGVGVLDPEDECATLLLREQPVEQRGPCQIGRASCRERV